MPDQPSDLTDRKDAPSELREPEYPPALFPTIFADGVSATLWGREAVKFYFYRADHDFWGVARGNKLNPTIQVTMTQTGFIYTALHFQRVMEQMLMDGTVTPDRVEEIRKMGDEQYAK